MRIFLFPAILIAASFAGCGKDAEKTATSSGSTTASLTEAIFVFGHTTAYPEADVQGAAARLAGAGQALSSALAERCWEAEAKRPSVQEACLLAWAAGGEESPVLTSAFRPKGGLPALRTRGFSIACIRKPGLLAALSVDGLLAVLEPLAADPPWLRGLAILRWLSANPLADPVQSVRVWNALRPREIIAKPAGPASIGWAYRIAAKLGLSQAQELLAGYCSPVVTGLAAMRCWRFLSVVANPDTGQGQDSSTQPFLPSAFTPGWAQFEYSFPERAKLIRK
jgi:hypothetical protein